MAISIYRSFVTYSIWTIKWHPEKLELAAGGVP